ncbi:chorismate synthase [Collinsella sp. zg1085]|uniref:chorismate synthase n=1 Tax=Collinsella sp. zg1085 TaxID=2844380 RepID=UPI001C0E63F0|nr:chorismate synthase [Collinsella sp. zg1085]QWT17071.1 chorismate synthase [Collinsella sp. zg1085]
MSSFIGSAIKLSIFGQSHSPAIGCVLDGVPAGYELDMEQLQTFCSRRAPGHTDISTPRTEADTLTVLGGIADGHSCGAPIAIQIANTNTLSRDYSELRRHPRPGHADWVSYVKYKNWHDIAGSGHFSGRLTAPLCAAGGIALQILQRNGIHIQSHVAQIGPKDLHIIDDPLTNISDPSCFAKPPSTQAQQLLANELSYGLAMLSSSIAAKAQQTIREVADELDSIGGIIETVAWGIPVGIGEPMFSGIENVIAQFAFGVPAVKGVEFGAGFAAAEMLGSEHNDPYDLVNNAVSPISNHAGGILGGISTGAPLIWRAAIKPTSSIGLRQHTVDLATQTTSSLVVHGRHDPCIVPRAVPVMEAVTALSLLDLMLQAGALTPPTARSL